MASINLNNYYTDFTLSMDRSTDLILHFVSSVANDISQKYEEITTTHAYRAFNPITKLAKSIKALATFFFNTMNSANESECLTLLNNIAETLFSFPLETALKIKTIVSFIKLKKLKAKLLKYVEKCRTTFVNCNEDEFTTAVLKVINTVSQIFDAPPTISKFLDIFSIKLPLIVEKSFLLTSAFSFFLQPANIILRYREYKYTVGLIKDLKREKYLAFLKSYTIETINISIAKTNLQLLSTRKLKKAVDLAKNQLRERCALQTLQRIKHVANLHYVNTLNEKIKSNPKILGNVFKVKFEKKQVPELKIAEFGENFFEDLASKEMQKISNQAKLDRAVKIIHSRIKFRISTHVYTLVTKSISWMSSLFGQIETFGIPLNPISPIRIIVEVSLAALSLINFFHQNKKKEEFVREMEAITGRHKILI